MHERVSWSGRTWLDSTAPAGARLPGKHPPHTEPVPAPHIPRQGTRARYSLDLQAGQHCLVDPGERAEEGVSAGAGAADVAGRALGSGGCCQTRPQLILQRCQLQLTQPSPQKDFIRKQNQPRFNPKCSLAASRENTPLVLSWCRAAASQSGVQG